MQIRVCTAPLLINPMDILIAADIFGHTLARLAGRLQANTIKIIDPYDGRTGGLHGFMNERSQNFDVDLYEVFLPQVHIPKRISKILVALCNNSL
jgi:hypothetical protein